MYTRLLPGLGGALLLMGCASHPRPHDMGVAEHQAVATAEEQAASAHAAQYAPNASETVDRCTTIGPAEPTGYSCWTSSRNPTAHHLDEAKRLHELAAQHRAASQALLDAEARACTGLSAEDRDISPFAHREDIARVEPLTESVNTGWEPATRLAGAVITFRAVPGMTGPSLQRVIDCHLARNAALGHVVPEMPWCPLVPKGVSAKVVPSDGGFAVYVRSSDPASSQEVLRRAQSLLNR